MGGEREGEGGIRGLRPLVGGEGGREREEEEGVHSTLGDVLTPLTGKKRKRWNPEDMDHAIALVEEKRMSAR